MSQPLHIWRIVDELDRNKMGVATDHDQAFNLVILAQQYGSSQVILNGVTYSIVGAVHVLREYFGKEAKHG